ncbi:MAG: 3'-5' exonuclease [Cytophagia bacterium]|nr:3'-5' exonuclease [Cytophagia bacterium]
MFIFLDTETTGAAEKDRLCQLAYKLETGEIVNELFKPPLPIAIDAMCVHHITNEMVENKPAFKETPDHRKLVDLLNDDKNILVAHNAKFDVNMLEKEGIHPKRVICTLKLARHLDPNGVIPRYSLQYLRYFLGIQIEATAHDALGDILVLEKLFERLFVKMSKSIGPAAVENRMMDISSKPVLLARMYFGKHKGQFFRDIPQDYLRWLSGKDDLDEDLMFTVGHYLK